MKLSRRSAMIGSQESETGSDVGSCFYGHHFVFVDNGNKTLKESKGDTRGVGILTHPRRRMPGCGIHAELCWAQS